MRPSVNSVGRPLFQSLTWVERLSDRDLDRRFQQFPAVSIPHLG